MNDCDFFLAAAAFSSVTNRTAGLNVLPTGLFRSAYLVFNMIMFIISSNPNAIAMKSSRRGSKSATQYTKELLINVVAGKKKRGREYLSQDKTRNFDLLDCDSFA